MTGDRLRCETHAKAFEDARRPAVEAETARQREAEIAKRCAEEDEKRRRASLPPLSGSALADYLRGERDEFEEGRVVDTSGENLANALRLARTPIATITSVRPTGQLLRRSRRYQDQGWLVSASEEVGQTGQVKARIVYLLSDGRTLIFGSNADPNATEYPASHRYEAGVIRNFRAMLT